MKLKKIIAESADGQRVVIVWAGTNAEAASERKRLVSELGFKRAEVATVEVDVPTNKEGLLAFLNSQRAR